MNLVVLFILLNSTCACLNVDLFCIYYSTLVMLSTLNLISIQPLSDMLIALMLLTYINEVFVIEYRPHSSV